MGPYIIPCHYLCSEGVSGLFVTKHGVDMARVTLKPIEIVHAAKVVKRIMNVTTSVYGRGGILPHSICAACLRGLGSLVTRKTNGRSLTGGRHCGLKNA